MGDNLPYTFPELFSKTVNDYGDCNAMAFVGEKPITYSELNDKVQALMAFLEKLGVGPGDKVGILSQNMPNWGTAYYAVTFMGAVAVPMLPDFHPTEIENILEHSEAMAIIVSHNLQSKLDDVKMDNVSIKISMDDFTLLDTENTDIFYNSSDRPQKEYKVDEEDLAVIIYTSGTTGTSKGVMLTHKNISFTAIKGKSIQPVKKTDRFLSVLPLSHTYENTLGLILPLLGGACVYYLKKLPTPAVLLPALQEVKPTIMLTVPLIIEKVYRNRVLPAINEKFVAKMLYKLPFFRKKIHQAAGKKLMQTFGGEIHFFGIGGAKLNSMVERFLYEAKFPYAIGYGLTETAPMLAGTGPEGTVFQSTGPVMEGVQLKIHEPDKSGKGEIWAKGPNLMKGYYKAPDLTAEVITEDGWFKTGDLGEFDKNNNLFIKGRLKNMIVGASGENIFPEEIESVINNFRYVVESLVVQQKGKLVAMVHFNREELEAKYQHLKEEVSTYVEKKMEELKDELHDYVNSRVNKFSQVQVVLVHQEPFTKTATQKIKRFLYS